MLCHLLQYRRSLQPRILLATVLLLAACFLLFGSKAVMAQGPTCSDVLGIENHGQHVVGDYVTGTGHENLDWPPAGAVGEAIRGQGAAAPGAPAANGHLPAGIAPGASFCNSQSKSPGVHP